MSLPELPDGSASPDAVRRVHSGHHELLDRVVGVVEAAWFRPYVPTRRLDVVMGTVAAATLIRMPSRFASAAAEAWESKDDSTLVDSLRRVWAMRWLEQPYLVHRARPVHRWLDEDPDSSLLAPARSIVAAMLRGGVLDLTGSALAAERREVDVLGHALTRLRAAGDRRALAEHPTPHDAADLIAVLTLDPGSDEAISGRAIADSCGGTGGLLLRAARRIARAGAEPCENRWYLSDLDDLAAACAAVNAITWGLAGPGMDNVLVRCGDTLTCADGVAEEAAVMTDVLAHFRRLTATATAIAGSKDLLAGP